MRLSILIVSRTSGLLNRFLASLNQACSLDPMQTEVICSWNGSREEELKITNSSRFEFNIAQRQPYHFAGNINSLVNISNAELLMIANDDLILDPDCVDAGVELLETRAELGLVGAVLRTAEGRLSHAGIHFDAKGSAYHPLDRMVMVGQSEIERSGSVAAVTGALQWIRRVDALAQPLNENYRVCGEDVELCLDVQQYLGKQVWLCGEAKAIHDAESTRAHVAEQAGNSEDLLRLRSRYHAYLAAASADQLRLLLRHQQAESHQLRALVRQREAQPSEAMLKLMERHAEQMERHAEQMKRHAEDELELRQLRQDALVIASLQEECLRLKARLMASPAIAASLEVSP